MKSYAFAGITIQIKLHPQLVNRLSIVASSLRDLIELVNIGLPPEIKCERPMDKQALGMLPTIRTVETFTPPNWQFPKELPTHLGVPKLSYGFADETACLELFIPALSPNDSDLEKAVVEGLLSVLKVTYEDQLLNVDAVVVPKGLSYHYSMTRHLYDVSQYVDLWE